MHNVKAVVAG